MVRCAAIDLGAGSGRVIAAELVDGRIVLTEAHRFDTPLRQNGSGTLYWDVDAIEEEVRAGLRAAQRVAPLDSLGIDSWGVDYVLLDGDHRRVGLAVAYRDARTDGMMPVVFERIPKEAIYRRTGIQFLPLNTLYQLAATARYQPGWTARARHFLMLPDYFNFRLCGSLANEYTNATTTQLYNQQSESWDPELLAAAGASPSWMLPVSQPGAVIGEMVACGQSIRVVSVASHDTASAVAGAPLQGADEAFISSGTWSLMGIESPVPFVGDDALRLNISNEGGYAHRYRVLKNIMGLWLLQRIRAELAEPRPSHGELAAAAGSAQPWRSVVDPDDGRFLNPPSMTAAVQEYCGQSGQAVPEDAASLARCVFDSLALSYRRVKEQLEALRGRPLSAIRIIGGGSQNRLLNQLCADACQLPVKAGPAETSALGNACVQMIALGAIADLDQARQLINQSFSTDLCLPRQTVPAGAWERFQASAYA